MRKTFNVYYIQDEKGRGLHYIRGRYYWSKLDDLENILDFTRFDTSRKALEFIEERDIPGFVGVYHIIVNQYD